MNKLKLSIGLLSLCIAAPFISYSQSLPVGAIGLEDYFRSQQLLGKADSSISFLIRPISLRSLNVPVNDTTLRRGEGGVLMDGLKGVLIKALPLVLKQQYNSAQPYGWNDGPMVPAKGYESMISAGIFLNYKFISIQLQPEWVFSQNSKYPGFASNDFDDKRFVKWYYEQYVNKIDAPERFGGGTYSKLFAGQSNLLVTLGPVSAGVSTESMWWGPGKRNSLLMSNNAAGFKHYTIHTAHPIHTSIGLIEAQIINGRLNQSGYFPIQDGINTGEQYFIPKPKDWRNISGLVATYQPKWVNGLFIGLARSAAVNHADMGNKLSSYLPISSIYLRNTEGADKALNRKQDLYSSYFLRWLFPKDNAEIYFEYGINDFHWNLRDFLIQPDHSRAYIAGITKMFQLKTKEDYIEASIEVTQMEASKTYRVRQSPPWYIHDQVRDGYTNLGEVLGAGIGSGGGLQSLGLNWKRGLKKIGLQFERYVHNSDFYYSSFVDPRIHWIDFSNGLSIAWDYKQFLLDANLQRIHSFNYQWDYKNVNPPGTIATPDEYWAPGHDTWNTHLSLNISFRF